VGHEGEVGTCILQRVFFAKMSTTQCSESMNHVLKKYVKPSSSINGFAKRYKNFFYDRIQAENTEEFHC
jgi:hypothetical protein